MAHSPLSSFISRYSVFGFGGSRSASPVCYTAAHASISSIHDLDSYHVFTTCGTGVLDSVRVSFAVNRIGVFRPTFSGRGALAARASSAIRRLSAFRSSLFICFPRVAAPDGCRVSRSWVSCGSGSWSEIAFAVGLGISVLVFLPSGVMPPASFGRWSFVAASAGGQFFTLEEKVELF